jgi:hypothetical protein
MLLIQNNNFTILFRLKWPKPVERVMNLLSLVLTTFRNSRMGMSALCLCDPHYMHFVQEILLWRNRSQTHFPVRPPTADFCKPNY